ncbi:MAG TPA: beta-propeller fold lactonase family protein, partial [Terriglobales bacterium]|nr:beta-propeller fold lactonase family protein [Terriglobales bacterium]
MNTRSRLALLLVLALAASLALARRKKKEGNPVPLPTSKFLPAEVPGEPQPLNSLPVTMVLSPDRRYLAILNNGYGTAESNFGESIAIADTRNGHVTDFPDPRFGKHAHQTYFIGLAFSSDGKKLYASVASITNPTGTGAGDTGNGIAVYKFEDGRISPERFLSIPLQDLPPGKRVAHDLAKVPPGKAVSFPAGLAVFARNGREELLVADNYSDDVIELDAESGKILRRFDLSTRPEVPSAFPYDVVATADGRRAFCSLWNASRVVELDLEKGTVARSIPLLEPKSQTAAGSHPTALLLSPDENLVYIALSNADAVAVVHVASGKLIRLLSTKLPGQTYGGAFPDGLAQSADGNRLFVANASTDSVAVFDVSKLRKLNPAAKLMTDAALGFIPTDWYPTALAIRGNDLFIASGKGKGTGPNANHGYIPTLLHGSLARVDLSRLDAQLPLLTDQVAMVNLLNGTSGSLPFRNGNPIHHVIYIIKENRTYDQIFGDLGIGNGDPSLTMYGEDITPNEHKLARQFGVLDNFYDSGEVSGDGHVWSTAAITSDYTEKTWQIAYRGRERTYDYEGVVAGEYPLEQHEADVNEPATGYIWANIARHALTYRHYGEFVSTEWCGKPRPASSPKEGPSGPAGQACAKDYVRKGEPLPPNVGQPHGSPSPWPWPVPMIARNIATKPELRGHFDPHFADFKIDYPDQLRADEFLNEFEQFVRARQQHKGTELPNFVLLRLPNDHTAAKRPGKCSPAACVADNDLAVGHVVEAVSHSPYWDDTAIFILEDDAQGGADHVDAHRSIALVISKYAPVPAKGSFIDH